MPNKLSKRFVELRSEAEQIEKSSTIDYVDSIRQQHVDESLARQWTVKTATLIVNACGTSSEHYRHWKMSEGLRPGETSFDQLTRLHALLVAAQDDFEGGYLSSMRSLVQAELFTNELEQASELLAKGYKAASAIIAGVVLETGLRELCTRHNILHGKLDQMNVELAKHGQYNLLTQKRITALAQIRNDAAHGKPDVFTPTDVSGMIAEVEKILAEHLS